MLIAWGYIPGNTKQFFQNLFVWFFFRHPKISKLVVPVVAPVFCATSSSTAQIFQWAQVIRFIQVTVWYHLELQPPFFGLHTTMFYCKSCSSSKRKDPPPFFEMMVDFQGTCTHLKEKPWDHHSVFNFLNHRGSKSLSHTRNSLPNFLLGNYNL